MPLSSKDQNNPERIHAVLQQFRILLRSMKRHYQSVEEQVELAGAQVWALSEIATNPDISVGDLAKRLAIHLSTASNLVRKMEQAGVVTRQRIGDDQRVVRLRATKEGLAALARAPGPPIGLLQRALLDLPGNRLVALQSELETLLAHVKHNDRRASTTPLAELWPYTTALKTVRTPKSSKR